MVTEVVRAFDGIDFETAVGGVAVTVWAPTQFWGLARDRNVAIVHVDVLKISGGSATITLVAEDSSGRIFTAMTLTANTATAKGKFRVVVKEFGAWLKLGLELSGGGGACTATASLEYTLKTE
jgi:hypothetical protein